MARFLRAPLALTAGLALVLAATAAKAENKADQAFYIGDEQGAQTAAGFELDSPSFGDVQLASCDSCYDDSCGCDTGCYDTCCDSGCGGGGGGSCLSCLTGPGCTGQCFVGGEFLYIRASYSDATAYLQQNLPALTPNPGFNYAQVDFDYGSSYRFYGGYRVCECGCEVRFTYTNIDSDASFQSPTQPADGSVVVTGPFEVITGGEGDSIFGDGRVEINDYDVAFSKTIPLGSPLGCCDTCCDSCGDGCCGDCCNDCCGCRCPAWDITWTGALRVADVESQLNYASNIVSTTAPLARTATSRVDFQGVGFRTGLLGRRYFGKSGMGSLYVKGDISLLLGDVDYSAVGTAFARHSISTTQIVPITEIEAGGTLFLTKNASISGGYMLAAWHDLGHRQMYDFGAAGVQLEGMDDANIMGLDGFFVRAEFGW